MFIVNTDHTQRYLVKWIPGLVRRGQELAVRRVFDIVSLLRSVHTILHHRLFSNLAVNQLQHDCSHSVEILGTSAQCVYQCETVQVVVFATRSVTLDSSTTLLYSAANDLIDCCIVQEVDLATHVPCVLVTCVSISTIARTPMLQHCVQL
jgi:hypothetical protein